MKDTRGIEVKLGQKIGFVYDDIEGTLVGVVEERAALEGYESFVSDENIAENSSGQGVFILSEEVGLVYMDGDFNYTIFVKE